MTPWPAVPLDFIAKLAALVPKPRVNLTRFHGVFASNSKCRVDVTLDKRGKGNPSQSKEAKTPEQRHQAMTWAQRLKRVFNINVSICTQCAGDSKVIASIEDQGIIYKPRGHYHHCLICNLLRGPHPLRIGLYSTGYSRWLSESIIATG
jgi:hypothetical protein